MLATTSGSPFSPCIFYGIVAAGGVFSGASTAFQSDELVRQIKDADAKLLMSSAEYTNKSVEAAERCGIPLDRVLVIDSTVPKRWSLSSALGREIVYQQGPNRQELDWPRLTTQHDLEQTTTCHSLLFRHDRSVSKLTGITLFAGTCLTCVLVPENAAHPLPTFVLSTKYFTRRF